MTGNTDHYGLSRLTGDDDFADDGYKFTDRDRDTIDRLLHLGAEGHVHTGETSSVVVPTAILQVALVEGTGSIPANTRVYYRYTLVDSSGLETTPSPEVWGDTPAPIAEPAAPTLSVSTTGGSLLPGNYYYVLSAYTNTNTEETRALNPAYITAPVGTSTNSITLTLPTLPIGASGFNIYRKKPGGVGYFYLTSVLSTVTTYTDTGAMVEDCNRAPTVGNNTHGNNSMQLTVDSAIPAGYTWRLYRTYVVGEYDNSLLHWVVEETAEGSGVITTTYTDTGQATDVGAPPERSLAVSSPSKLKLGDMAEVEGRLPMGAVSAFPTTVSFAHSGVLTNVVTGSFVWVCDAPRATIIGVRAALGLNSKPVATDVIVDVNRLTNTATPVSSTIFTVQANRPRVVVGSQVGGIVVPDIKELVQGEALTVDIDQVGGGATPTDRDLVVQIMMYVYGFGLISHPWAT